MRPPWCARGNLSSSRRAGELIAAYTVPVLPDEITGTSAGSQADA
jgi:hypothetical protein